MAIKSRRGLKLVIFKRTDEFQKPYTKGIAGHGDGIADMHGSGAECSLDRK